MGNTRFSGPVSSGDIPNSYTVGTTNYTANVGLVVLSQNVTVNGNATASIGTAFLPQQSQIMGLLANTQTAWTAAATAVMGTPTTSTAYMSSSLNVAGAGATSSFVLTTAALNIGTTPAVVITVTGTAAATTGQTVFTLVYSQTTSTFS